VLVKEFRVLGPLAVVNDDGEPLALGGPRQRAVLTLLLLRAGEAVSTDFLIDALWGPEPPRTATTSLQNAISALRKVLGPELLLTRPPGYVLAVPKEQTDVGRFERLVKEARALVPEERARTLRAALDLWRGQPLADVMYEAFAEADVLRLEELRLATLEEYIDAELAAGHVADVIPELESLVARHPLRERLRGQLMLALYRTGRQSDALAAFQAGRRAFAEELGLDPGPELAELHAQILRQEVPRLTAPVAEADEDHCREVVEALLGGRLVVVLGSDVSQLAHRLARRFDYPDADGDLTRIAEYVALTKGSGPLYDELHAMLEAGGAPTAVHGFLAALPRCLRERGAPHQLVVTAAYDLALERAFLAAGEPFDIVSYVAAGRHRGRFSHIAADGEVRVIEEPHRYVHELSLVDRTVILKVHGGLESGLLREHETFVVTEDDYIDYLTQAEAGNAVPISLAAALRRSHFLFLGYSMQDWNLRLVLARIWGSEGLNYRSWAVEPEAKLLERRLWHARDVELIELPLDQYVSTLSRYVGLGVEVAA
jgi:DNA-binding SARP family transcriptional activator